jgi:hypothetical protein
MCLFLLILIYIFRITFPNLSASTNIKRKEDLKWCQFNDNVHHKTGLKTTHKTPCKWKLLLRSDNVQYIWDVTNQSLSENRGDSSKYKWEYLYTYILIPVEQENLRNGLLRCINSALHLKIPLRYCVWGFLNLTRSLKRSLLCILNMTTLILLVETSLMSTTVAQKSHTQHCVWNQEDK